MTERSLPAVSFPVPAAHPRPAAVPRATTRSTVRRSEPFLTTPARAGMLLGGTAAIYAGVLAGVATLQASDDAVIAARRQPWVEAVAAERAANDELEATLAAANDNAKWLGDGYADVSSDVAAFRAQLDELAALVSDVEGSAAALPTRVALPAVTMRGAVAPRSGGGTTRAPSTTSTTGASGG
jgi:hypothetical protein